MGPVPKHSLLRRESELHQPSVVATHLRRGIDASALAQVSSGEGALALSELVVDALVLGTTVHLRKSQTLQVADITGDDLCIVLLQCAGDVSGVEDIVGIGVGVARVLFKEPSADNLALLRLVVVLLRTKTIDEHTSQAGDVGVRTVKSSRVASVPNLVVMVEDPKDFFPAPTALVELSGPRV